MVCGDAALKWLEINCIVIPDFQYSVAINLDFDII